MPLYEFYCEPCHTIYTFRFPRVDTQTIPTCPVCKHALKKEVSRVNCILRKDSSAPADSECTFSAAELEDAQRNDLLAQMERRLHALDESDGSPAEALALMQRMAHEGGYQFNSDVAEAFARIEAGEDPEKVCDAFDEVFNAENPFASTDGSGAPATQHAVWRYFTPPRHDPTWYDPPKLSQGGQT